MALQYAVAIRNAQLDIVESQPGTGARVKIFQSGGSPPANCAAADVGTVLCDMTLDTDWMAAASGGTKAKAGTWQDVSADNAGVADYFRIYDSTATTCYVQGTCGIGSGDLQLDNTNIAAGQQVTITAFTLTAGNA